MKTQWFHTMGLPERAWCLYSHWLIEPMINQGTASLYIDRENNWTSYTSDGKLSAQWEHMLLVTEDGYEILSK